MYKHKYRDPTDCDGNFDCISSTIQIRSKNREFRSEVSHSNLPISENLPPLPFEDFSLSSRFAIFEPSLRETRYTTNLILPVKYLRDSFPRNLLSREVREMKFSAKKNRDLKSLIDAISPL